MALLPSMLQLAFFLGLFRARSAVLGSKSTAGALLATAEDETAPEPVASCSFLQTTVLSRDSLPTSAQSQPLLGCHSLTDSGNKSSWEQTYHAAAKLLCANKANWPYMEVFLDSRFVQQYSNFYGPDGWMDRAWVNYAKADGRGDYWALLTERLVDSIHRHSAYPIVVVNFGEVGIPDLEPERFPRLILLHARGFPKGMSFNFNKLRAVLFSHVKTGASLDSDMMMVGRHADQLLQRTEEEVTESYPWPMMPTHFLTRDPRESGKGLGNHFLYECAGCPTPTMRWGQAQPSWTFWSLPFFARWWGAKLAGRQEQGVNTLEIGEDEDLLNVALWREGATKAWCMYQMGGVGFVWENYFPEHAPGPSPFYGEPRFFPHGVPLGFFFSHAEKELGKVDQALEMLERHRNTTASPPKAFFHMMKFYDTFAQLKADHPDLKCTL
eukprot:CAMPEP_0172802802 /NCGR_PEP_ID=MMETSP1075-20121228/4097_1 /TAXON_ID=2916 /ORGANISM="Ceratium fusus, Strain PA161109" /LENGTH=438 /DNA_ID=CAMNT_0013641119 /DNA_START=56 /DNA_END=1372 /DNA_ORIENTATION=-